MPNVNSIVESMDMREAQRSYEANLNAIENCPHHAGACD
jgi:flagellar basal-body rod protein FlgC